MLKFQAPPVDHDRLFKELLTTFFWEFLELFFPTMPPLLDRRSLRFLDKETFTDVTSGEKRVADVLAQVRWKEPPPGAPDVRFLIHVENQSSAQAQFGKRMFRYFARLHEKHDVPVFPIVIFSYDRPLRAEPDVYRVAFPDGPVLDFHYRVIQLNRLHWRDFVKRENPVAGALMAKMQIAPEDRVKVKFEFLRLLVTLKLNPAKMQLISGFVDTYLKLNREEAAQLQQEVRKTMPEKQEVVMEIMNSWMLEGMEKGWNEGVQKGLQEGVQKGLQEGVQKGEANLVLRLLGRRLGPLSAAQQKRIQRLAVEQLEELGDALLDFSSKKELNDWLAAHK